MSGALTVLMKDAIKPNLMQTLEVGETHMLTFSYIQPVMNFAKVFCEHHINGDGLHVLLCKNRQYILDRIADMLHW